MRVLLLSTADPGDFSCGGYQRSNYIREALLRIAQVDTIVIKDAEQSLIRSDWGPERVIEVKTSRSAGKWERIRLRTLARRMISSAEASNNYDFIVARYFGTAILVPLKDHHKLIVDGDDLRQTGFGQPLARRAFLHVRAALIRIIARRAFHIWLVDARDRDVVPPKTSSMLPNTAKGFINSSEVRCKYGQRILMVGFLAYPPNEEGLVWFTREVWPEVQKRFVDVELHVIGRYHKQSLKELGARVKMRGFVDDLSEEYMKADLVICPIRSGSGTQIKVIEALMSARPTLVSDFSYQGFSDVLKPGEHLLVAQDGPDWIRQITTVLDDPAAFVSMALKGRKVADETYSVEVFCKHVASTFTF